MNDFVFVFLPSLYKDTKIFSFVFGSNKNFKICFWDLLTFSKRHFPTSWDYRNPLCISALWGTLERRTSCRYYTFTLSMRKCFLIETTTEPILFLTSSLICLPKNKYPYFAKRQWCSVRDIHMLRKLVFVTFSDPDHLGFSDRNFNGVKYKVLLMLHKVAWADSWVVTKGL